MSGSPGRYVQLPRDPNEPVRLPRADLTQKIVGPVRVVGLGAICDLGRTSKDRRSQSISFSEFALLNDGRRVLLHSERGYTEGWGAGFEIPGDLSIGETAESMTQQVLNTVIPDDEDCEDAHPWSWLAELARARGLDVTADDLRVLPYDVILDESITRWLQSGGWA